MGIGITNSISVNMKDTLEEKYAEYLADTIYFALLNKTKIEIHILEN